MPKMNHSIEENLERIANAVEAFVMDFKQGKPDIVVNPMAEQKPAKPVKPAEADPLADPPEGEKKNEWTLEDVTSHLRRLIVQDGKAAAFEVLAEKGGGATSATRLDPKHFEDVIVECKERLG